MISSHSDSTKNSEKEPLSLASAALTLMPREDLYNAFKSSLFEQEVVDPVLTSNLEKYLSLDDKLDQYKNMLYAKWESFSVESHTKGKSYTNDLYVHASLKDYLNFSAPRLLQFGASAGIVFDTFLEAKWQVIAYDYSHSACKFLSNKGVAAREIDLNQFDRGELSYKNQLLKDLQSPCNILLVRILIYLKPSTVHALLLFLIENAKPGSTFIIGEPLAKPSSYTGMPHRNFLLTFFSVRTDVELKENRTFSLHASPGGGRDKEQLVIAKKI